MVTPFEHFGSAWGKVLDDNKTIEIHSTTLGKWHVLITASRKDDFALNVDQNVEFQEDIEIIPDHHKE